MKTRDIIEGLRPKTQFPEFRVGDTVKVNVKIREGEKERIQVFEGAVIKKRRSGVGSSFTVRKLSYGVGVERVFPFDSSAIESIEVVQRGKVRRAKLYYLRKRTGRDASVQEADDAPTAAEPVTPEVKTESIKAPKIQVAGVPAS